jgi:hypothetical protein
MKRLWLGSAILGITLLNFFQFPGHTWLQSDTQIYMPILEHMSDASVLQKDLIAQHPHVAFTLYDESAIALRKITSLDFRQVLQSEQFVCRAMGIWGVYLIATALGLADLPALIVAAVFSLGATIMGPAVLVFEYEPVPRGFAGPLIFLAIGLIAHERYLGAGVAASVAFLFHPPTVAPFWAVYFVLALQPSKPLVMRHRLTALWALATAVIVLFIAARYQASSGETQAFFTRLDPHLEELQRMRASYNWISLWWQKWLGHYLLLYAVAVIACWRLGKAVPQALRYFLIGLPLLAVLSLPASYLLLEKMHWALIPEFQPVRALLFVTAFAMILGAVAAAKAMAAKRYAEALVWLVLAFLPPANREVAWPAWNRVGVVLVVALLTAAALWVIQSGRRWSKIAAMAAILAPFFLIPTWGRMQNYSMEHTPDLAQLSQWARTATPKDAVFLFPDADQALYPGIFRVESMRAVYVDWKAGGQVNFFKELGEEWWSRWQKTMAAPFDPKVAGGAKDAARYRDLGIDYIVLQAKNRLVDIKPVFENGRFVVYPAGAVEQR